MSPQERSRQRIQYYQKLIAVLPLKEASDVADILTKPTESISSSDLAYLRSKQEKINKVGLDLPVDI